MATILTISGGNVIPSARPAGGITTQAVRSFAWLMQSVALAPDRCIDASLARDDGVLGVVSMAGGLASTLDVTPSSHATLEGCYVSTTNIPR